MHPSQPLVRWVCANIAIEDDIFPFTDFLGKVPAEVDGGARRIYIQPFKETSVQKGDPVLCSSWVVV